MPLTISDELIIAATVTGPILAVQAQKWIEKATQKRRQKLGIFYALMATRATRLAAEHVQALNRIDLEFSGSRLFGVLRRQSTKERAVYEAWKSYHDTLSVDLKDKTPDEIKAWNSACDTQFVELVYFMSNAVGYYFDRVQIRRGIYYPTGHEDFETTQKGIQSNLLKVLSGQAPLKMDITRFPFSDEASAAQQAFQKAVTGAISPDGEVRVSLVPSSAEFDKR